MLTPNDSPLVCLPLELPAEAVAELKRHYDALASARRVGESDDTTF